MLMSICIVNSMCEEVWGILFWNWNETLKKRLILLSNIVHIIFHLINSTLLTRKQSRILSNKGKNGPGWPLTFWTLLTFHFDLCLSTGLAALPTLWGVVSSCWFVWFLFFTFFYIYITYYVLFCFCLLPWPRWFSCAVLEWRVSSKTVDGADSLWGNKPSHRTPHMPQHRLASQSPAHSRTQTHTSSHLL